MADTKNSAKAPVYESQESLYEKAVKKMNADKLIVQYAFKIDNYLKAAAMFDEVGDYLDAPEKAELCRELARKAEIEEKNSRYRKAQEKKSNCENVKDYEKLAEEFAQLGDYKDAVKEQAECENAIKRIYKKRKLRRFFSLAVVVTIVVLVFVGRRVGFFHYLKGIGYGLTGKYDAAQQIFEELGSFLDSEKKAESYAVKALIQREEEENSALKKAKPKDEISFGTHTWKVLSRDGDLIYMIATQVSAGSEFYQVPFHDKQENVTWEGSSLREWLNSEVLENSFSEKERASLVLMDTEASDNSVYGISGGMSTRDYLRILSVEEAEQYMDILKSLGLDYWLRTPGNCDGTEAYISAGHVIMDYGYPATSEKLSVRPVITVDWTRLDEEE